MSKLPRPQRRKASSWVHIAGIEPTLSTPHAKWSCQKKAIRSWIGSAPVEMLLGWAIVVLMIISAFFYRCSHQLTESLWAS